MLFSRYLWGLVMSEKQRQHAPLCVSHYFDVVNNKCSIIIITNTYQWLTTISKLLSSNFGVITAFVTYRGLHIPKSCISYCKWIVYLVSAYSVHHDSAWCSTNGSVMIRFLSGWLGMKFISQVWESEVYKTTLGVAKYGATYVRVTAFRLSSTLHNVKNCLIWGPRCH